MLSILKYGGLAPGGINFDAKVRRESFEPIDLFHAHIGGMDAFARGLKIAAAIRADGQLDKMLQGALRLVGLGRRRRDRSRARQSFASLEKYMLEKGDVDARTRAAARKCSRTSSTPTCKQKSQHRFSSWKGQPRFSTRGCPFLLQLARRVVPCNCADDHVVKRLAR